MFRIKYAEPSWEALYDPDTLSANDRVRAASPRAARAQRDWRVSRALAAVLRREAGVSADASVALSHSQGHALAALTPPGWRVAVDLERCRPRDVTSLMQWVCSSAEQAALAAMPEGAERLEAFYVLWTLKESLLKAAGLPFPAGMAQVGVDPVADTLRAPGDGWRATVWRLPGDWIAAAVWRPDEQRVTGEPGGAIAPCWEPAAYARMLRDWSDAPVRVFETSP